MYAGGVQCILTGLLGCDAYVKYSSIPQFTVHLRPNNLCRLRPLPINFPATRRPPPLPLPLHHHLTPRALICLRAHTFRPRAHNFQVYHGERAKAEFAVVAGAPLAD
jgi:hypothetical protein